MTKLQNANDKHEQILVIFDTHHCSHVSLQSIINLASSLKAAIHGLYVEDANVLNAANLPFSREVTLQTAKVRKTSASSMERELRAYADRVRDLLQQHATTARVTSSFSIIRGPRLATIIRESRDARLVVFPAVSSKWSSTGAQNDYHLRNTIALYYDGTDSADSALSIATSIANRDGADLVVMTSERAHAEKLRQGMQTQSLKVIVHSLKKQELGTLLTELSPYSPRLFVLPESSQLVQNSDYLHRLVDHLHCDVLMVR